MSIEQAVPYIEDPQIAEEELTKLKKEEQVLKEEVLASGDEDIEKIDHIDFIKLKNEVQNWEEWWIKKEFLHIDGKSYIINFKYDPSSDFLWVCEDWKISINLSLCEQSYNLAKDNNKKFNLWLTDISIDTFVLWVLQQEIYHQNHPDQQRKKIEELWLAMSGTTHWELVAEALSEFPSLDIGGENYFYAVRFFSIIDELLRKDLKQDKYKYEDRESYELMFKRYEQACENILKKNYPHEFTQAKKDAENTIKTWWESENWVIIRRKYKYVWPTEDKTQYFDIIRDNANIELFEWDTLKDEYKNLFVRVGDLFDDKWQYNPQKKEDTITKYFAFVKKQDMVEIIQEYKRIVLETNK